MVRTLTIAAAVAFCAVASAQTAPTAATPPATTTAAPLDDARLGASAAELHAAVDRAQQSGLPSELLVAKVREGLAKNVPPPRIVAVVRGLGEALQKARAEAQPFAGATPPPGLLKAIVEAHTAHASADDVATVLRAGGRERALAVLTDLAQRGYPTAAAARAVARLSGKSTAIEQLVGQAERLRAIEGAGPAEALDALVRAGAQSGSFDHAESFLRHGADASDETRAPNRETSGPRGPASGGVGAPGKGRGRP